MKFKATIVRLKETFEPVLFSEKIDDIVMLGRIIDELTDPYACEYLDVNADVLICAGFINQCGEMDCDSIIIESPVFLNFSTESIIDIFIKNQDSEWLELPALYDYLSGKSAEDQLGV